MSGLLVMVLGASGNAVAAARSQVRHVSARNLASGFVAEPVASSDLRPAERAFLNQAVETSRQQMRLAEVGASQADNSEVRSRAQQLAGDYKQIDEALEALLRRKGGIANAPVGGTSETYQKLVANAGANFDREFVRVAAQLNQSTLSLFEQAASDAKDPDVREFAAAQLPVLRAHRTAIMALKKTLG